MAAKQGTHVAIAGTQAIQQDSHDRIAHDPLMAHFQPPFFWFLQNELRHYPASSFVYIFAFSFFFSSVAGFGPALSLSFNDFFPSFYLLVGLVDHTSGHQLIPFQFQNFNQIFQ